jgi:hypothetical protein
MKPQVKENLTREYIQISLKSLAEGDLSVEESERMSEIRRLLNKTHDQIILEAIDTILR